MVRFFERLFSSLPAPENHRKLHRDFYCHKAKLVIELDGSQHYEEHAKAYDNERTRFLEAAGLDVIRFPNAAVDHDFEGVCTVIHQTIQANLKQ